MYFKETHQTKNYEKDKKWNPVRRVPRYIIIHHTGNIWLLWNLRTLLWLTNRKVSAHFLISKAGDAYKLSDPEYNTRHEWKSSRKWSDVSRVSLWIEVEWPWQDWEFTYEQKIRVKETVRHLMKVYWIPKENVLRHADIAPWRKNDIAESFYKPKYNSREEYQDSLPEKIVWNE